MNQIYSFPSEPRVKYEVKVTVSKTWPPTNLSLMMFMGSEKHLKMDDERAFLELLFKKLPKVKLQEKLIRGFKQLFITKEHGVLKKWIEEALKSDCGLKNFAKKTSRETSMK
ncbi:hypothetical protein [Sphingobacterium kyonggiense]